MASSMRMKSNVEEDQMKTTRRTSKSARQKTAGKKTSQDSTKKSTAAKRRASGKTSAKKTSKKQTDVKAAKAAKPVTAAKTVSEDNVEIPLSDEILLVASFGLMVILMISNFGLGGTVGEWLSCFLFGIFGIVQYVMPLAFFLGVLVLIANDFSVLSMKKTVSGFALLLTISAAAQMFLIDEGIPFSELFGYCVKNHVSGGILGGGITYLLNACFGKVGTGVVLGCIFVLSLIVLTQRSLVGFFDKLLEHFKEWTKKEKEQHQEHVRKRKAKKEADRYIEVEEEEASKEKTAPKKNVIEKYKSFVRARQFDSKVKEIEEERRSEAKASRESRSAEPKTRSKNVNMPIFIPSDEVKKKDAVQELHAGMYPFTAEDGKTEPFEGSLDFSAFAFSTDKSPEEFEKEIHDHTRTLKEQKEERDSYLPPYKSKGAFVVSELSPKEEDHELFDVIENPQSSEGQEILRQAKDVQNHLAMGESKSSPRKESGVKSVFANAAAAVGRVVQSSMRLENIPEASYVPVDQDSAQVSDGSDVTKPEVIEEPESFTQREVVEEPKSFTQPEIVEEPESFTQPEIVEEPESFTQREVVEEPGSYTQPEIIEESESFTQPELVEEFESVLQPDKVEEPEVISESEEADQDALVVEPSVEEDPVEELSPEEAILAATSPIKPAKKESDLKETSKKETPEKNQHVETKATPAVAEMAAAPVKVRPAGEGEYIYPPMSLLDSSVDHFSAAHENSIRETAQRLQSTLASFGVNVTITDVSCGPTVTRYEMFPEQGTKVSKIVSLTDDIKLNLAAADIRIEAPIPGKAAIGIEVPNKHNMTVHFREVIDNQTFRKFKSRLAFAVGKDIGGKIVVTDLAKMPHLLIAGATGSGKSVCINTLIMSILYKATPDEVRMIMIDPKMVELNIYNGIPHLLIPVVTDPKKASGALNWAVAEMTDRYKRFAETSVRNIEGYNKKVDELIKSGQVEADKLKKMPQIVIIIDELADLMMVAPGEVEDAIVRLSQLARAAGIHLVIATQRPSVNVITGLIKANVPSRIAFSVSSGVDSRTIIDMNGAEKLLGKGDMLFYPAGYQKPVRLQGALISDAEIANVVDFLKKNENVAHYDTDITEDIQTKLATSKVVRERDEYFEAAARLIMEKDKATIGMLQRALKIGFNRAARIIDQLADAGIVGPEEGTKPRKILMSPEQLEQFFEENL